MKKPAKGPPPPAPEKAPSEVIHTGQAVGAEQKLGAVQVEARPCAPQPVTVTVTQRRAKAAPEALPPEPPPPAASPKNRSRVAAYGMVGSVLERVAQEAQRRGGGLSADDIRAMAGELAQQTETLAGSLDQSFEAYALEKETAALQQARQRHFERLMVKRFSHLLSDEDPAPDEHNAALPRRVVPAFNRSLNVFMGPDEYQRMQERAEALVEKVKRDAAGNFYWGAVYQHPEAPQLVLDALMTIAANFQDTERRVKWFTEYIDKNMTPPAARSGRPPPDADADENAEADGAGWHFDDETARRMLKSLFSMLWGALGDQQGRDRLIKRHGAAKVAAAAKVVNVFC